MDFRKKLLALSVLAAASAGVSFGQSCGSPSVAPNAVLPNLLRIEGTNELVSDITVTCPASTVATAQISISLNASVTSKQVSAALNEATLLITTGATTTPYAGVVSGGNVTFGGSAGVTLPTGAGYTMRIANIRVNASAQGVGTYVTENILATNNGVVEYAANGLQVGYVQQGFATPSIVAGTVKNYAICSGNPVASATASFSVKVSALFGGAFKTQTGAGSAGEQGSYTGGAAPAGVGTANSGTRIQFAFANIAPGATLYVPTSINNGGLTMTLTSSATGPFSAVASSVPTGASAALGGNVAVTAANGAATAVYEVTATDITVPNANFTLTGVVVAPANFATTAQAPMTVIATPVPTGTTNVPNFTTSSNAALNLTAFTACQTNLLFPFLTNTNGFDVGIVLANTSTDPFGTGATATPAPGSCTLNFYGSGAPTPATGVAAPGGSQASGTTNAFLLSSVAPGFTGYMIAQCNYLYGHGFAYIAYNLTQNSGTSMGYLAQVMSARPVPAGVTDVIGQ